MSEQRSSNEKLSLDYARALATRLARNDWPNAANQLVQACDEIERLTASLSEANARANRLTAERDRLTAELERERRGWSASQQISELLAERDELRRWQHEARKIMLADGTTDETEAEHE